MKSDLIRSCEGGDKMRANQTHMTGSKQLECFHIAHAVCVSVMRPLESITFHKGKTHLFSQFQSFQTRVSHVALRPTAAVGKPERKVLLPHGEREAKKEQEWGSVSIQGHLMN